MNKLGLRRAEVFFLLILTVAGFGLRLYRVGSISLAEDEAAKWLAIQEYKKGHFIGVNSEHPLMMKLLAWASLEIVERWNNHMDGQRWLKAREEAALRMPNLIVGALTTIVIYLLGKEMLGIAGAGAAASFWALTPLPIALNRILKEDTLVTFFTYLAIYFFWRAKRTGDDAEAEPLFLLSAASFGLAFASKYYLHFLGLSFLVWLIAGEMGLDRRPFLKPFATRYWLTTILVFILADPVVLSPTHDLGILGYIGEKTVVHHGYNLNGQLYMNNIGNTPYGLPPYFYLWALAVKTPLPVLLAMIAGVVLVIFNRRSLTSIFLRVMLVFCFIPLSLVASKSIRYLLDMLPFLFLLGGNAVDKLYGWLARCDWALMRRWGVATAALLLVLWPALESAAWTPLYPLYLNQLGGGRSNVARIFPHDELYDLGVREAVEYTCQVAPRGAVLAVSNPMAVGYYLKRCGRTDIRVGALFDPQYVMHKGDFLLIQESRRYFETEDLFRQVERHGQALREVSVQGVVTSRIYRF